MWVSTEYWEMLSVTRAKKSQNRSARAQNGQNQSKSVRIEFVIPINSNQNSPNRKSNSEISEIIKNRQNRHFAGNCLWILNFKWSRTDFVNLDCSELIFHVIFEVLSAFSSWIWCTLTYLLISIIVQYTWICAFWMVYQVFWWFWQILSILVLALL